MPATRARERARRAVLLVAAGLSLGAATPARDADGAPAGGGTLRIAADPPRLLLGRDAAAELRIAAPPEVEDVSVTASAGKIEGLRRIPGGGFAARFRAPAERVPQVAIVAAVARTAHGTEDGWIAIPLSGQGDAKVRAAPGQEITLQIGDRSFGPRRAGDDGIAVIPVVVPPGVREAHHGFRPIDLHVPETPLLHAALERPTVYADRPEKVRVLAYVVAPHGAARRGDVPVFEASRGFVSAVEREPGAIEATWTLPPGRAGEERLTVRLAAAPASRAVLKLEAVAGPPAVVAVAFDRDALVADAADAVTVTARVLDAAGNPVPSALSLETDGGELGEVREKDAGVEARLHVAPSFGGLRAVRVTASAPAIGISGGRTLPLRPGEPAQARFDVADAVVRTGGGEPTLLRVAVADRHGNPVHVAPAVTAERGKVLGVTAAGEGTFDVRYLPPRVSSATSERLVATAGAARATAARVLLPGAPRYTVAPGAGPVLDLRGRFAGVRAGIAAERPADLAPVVRRGLELAWRLEGDALLSLGSGEAASVLAGASLARALGPRATLQASVTGGAMWVERGVSPAARLALGASLRRPGVEPFAEVSVIAAGGGAPGAFAAVAFGAGLRIGRE